MAHGRPSGWWYLVALLLPFAGCGVSFATGFGGMADAVRGMERVVVPGEAQVELEAGDYTAYYEHKSRVDGHHFATPEGISGLECQLGGPGGESIPLEGASTSTEYTINGYSGSSLFSFEAPASGTYAIACSHGDDAGTRVVLAIGQGVASSILLAIAAPLVGALAGLVFFVLLFLKRRRRDPLPPPPPPPGS